MSELVDMDMSIVYDEIKKVKKQNDEKGRKVLEMKRAIEMLERQFEN
jgi:hypothetical protein